MVSRTTSIVSSLAFMLVLSAPFVGFGGNATEVQESVNNYHLYFGDLHTHTAYSDAWEGTPDDAYEAAAAAGADFMATTDHYYMLTPEEWNATLLAADTHTTSTFVAMAGYEYWMPSKGEVNVYNSISMPPSSINPANHGNPGNHAPSWSALTTFYDWLADQGGAMAQWNHPYYMTKDFQDYSYWSAARDQGMGMIEVYNTKDCESSYIMALDQGWHVMPTANSDTHNPNWISGYETRTVLLAPSLTRTNLYEAMTESRGYATLDKNLEISYKLNGEDMGSILSPETTSYSVSIHIKDPDSSPGDQITMVELVSDGGAVAASWHASGTEVTLSGTVSSESAHYYYLRVFTASGLEDAMGVTAWTAPVWTGR